MAKRRGAGVEFNEDEVNSRVGASRLENSEKE